MLLSSFHQDGPIVRVILHKSHALLTFKDINDARSAIRKNHYLDTLDDLPSLKHLRMDSRIINGILLEKFANCKHLEVLDVIDFHADGNMGEQFANLQYLRVLKINQDMGKYAIIIELIKKCTGLRYIDLSLCYEITTDLLRGILPHLLETLGPEEYLEMRVGYTQLSDQVRRANDDDFIDLHGKIKLDHNVQKTKYSLEDLLLFNEDYYSFYNFDTDDKEWED
uniref:RNI-like protein n=1 Tax=Lutzomyia longipalpis TaxID=7200 RepID=A0A1B0CJM9_LUTLO